MEMKLIKENCTGMIFKFSISSVIAMILMALITIVDGFFMGNYVGEEGIAAVNMGLPIIYLYLGAGLMVSIGGAAISGMALGAGEFGSCNQVFRQTVLTAALLSAGISLAMVFCFEPMLSILHAEGRVRIYFQEYYQIMLLELPVMVLNSSFGMFIRGDGNPGYYMKTSVVNTLLNVLLDYLFAGLLGKGAAGIAYASLLSALVSLACILYGLLTLL